MNRRADANREPVQLESERLLLRMLRDSDQELYCDLFSNVDTMRYIGPPLSRQRAAQRFSRVLAAMRREPPQALFLAIIQKAADEPVGICSVQNFDAQCRSAELGMMLKPLAQLQRFGREALIALARIAFELFAVDEIWLQSAANHVVAERLALGVGFSRSNKAGSSAVGENRRSWSAYRESWKPSNGF